MPPSPAAASGIAPSRPTITVLVTAIAICARLAAASGSASADVARSSDRNPLIGFICSLSKRKGPDRYRRGPVSSRVGCVQRTRIPSAPAATPHESAVLMEHAAVNSSRHALHLGLGAGALGDQAIVLDAAVLLEIEDRALDVVAKL